MSADKQFNTDGKLLTAKAPPMPPLPSANAPVPLPVVSPTPPLEQIINPVPAQPKAPQAPTLPVPRSANDPVPLTIAPPPVVPAPKAPAPAPAAGPVFAGDDMLVRMVVDGANVDVPLKELKAKGQILQAHEKRLSEVGRMKAELNREAELGRLVLAHKDNPELLDQRVRETLGLPPRQAENTTAADDDGSDPRLKEALARLQRLEARDARSTAEQHATALQVGIREQLDSFPLFKNSRHERDAAEVVVAAHIRMGATPEDVSTIIGKWHAGRSEALTEVTTHERDQRAEQAAMHAAVAPSAGTPALTTNDLPKPSTKEWQKNPGRAFGSLLEQAFQKLNP